MGMDVVSGPMLKFSLQTTILDSFWQWQGIPMSVRFFLVMTRGPDVCVQTAGGAGARSTARGRWCTRLVRCTRECGSTTSGRGRAQWSARHSRCVHPHSRDKPYQTSQDMGEIAVRGRIHTTPLFFANDTLAECFLVLIVALGHGLSSSTLAGGRMGKDTALGS
jgi:hypothetical protein